MARTTVGKIGATSFRSKMRIIAENTDALIAKGYIAAVMMDKAVETPVAIPADMKRALEGFQI